MREVYSVLWGRVGTWLRGLGSESCFGEVASFDVLWGDGAGLLLVCLYVCMYFLSFAYPFSRDLTCMYDRPGF